MTPRPRLHPAVAHTRRAVRDALAALPEPAARGPLVVGLSGGADSLALAAAVAFEAPKRGVTAVAVIVDHGLQEGSDAVARRAAEQAASLGLRARIERVEVTGPGGPEASARAARYEALRRAAAEIGAEPAGAAGSPVADRAAAATPPASVHLAPAPAPAPVLVAHTRDDQAETVLLGLARGSGAASLSGMAARTRLGDGILLRPFLDVPRETTHAACAALGLEPWHDPQNDDPAFARVRVRHTVLPMLERELGPGIADALARTAEQLREDADAFDEMVDELIEDIVEHAEAGIAVSAEALAANPAALRGRIVRRIVQAEFGQFLSRVQTLEAVRLATDWRGQGPIDLPGCRARRDGGWIVFTGRAEASA